ncbi:signal transduction histidine kinase [Rhodococcus sp. LBL1]|nr:signal transduction histidine kinase [Rhodococcus sp. LBL1]MDH6683687.1 signal transduction histidine kinase [Rhodococcus sp. LBL2]
MMNALSTGIAALLRPEPVALSTRWRAPTSWAGALRVSLGVLLVVGLFATSVVQLNGMLSSVAVCYAIGALQTLPLLLSCAAPILAWQLVALGMFAGTISGLVQDGAAFAWPSAGCVAALIAVYRLARARPSNVAIAAVAVSVMVVAAPAMWTVGMPLFRLVTIAIALTAVAVAGSIVQQLRSTEIALAGERQERIDQDRHQAVMEERTRIARELHDVVAHHMSMIAVQAQAARFKNDALPPAATDAFDNIHQASVTALTEMRQVVELLRDPDEGTEHAPAPNLSDLDTLVDQWRRSGAQLTLRRTGSFADLPETLSASAYRIVQESLTNAARHAPGAAVDAEIVHLHATLAVRVSNAVTETTSSSAGSGEGRGLLGIRERAAVFGGRATAGLTDDGRYEVSATFPIQA